MKTNKNLIHLILIALVIGTLSGCSSDDNKIIEEIEKFEEHKPDLTKDDLEPTAGIRNY